MPPQVKHRDKHNLRTRKEGEQAQGNRRIVPAGYIQVVTKAGTVSSTGDSG